MRFFFLFMKGACASDHLEMFIDLGRDPIKIMVSDSFDPVGTFGWSS